MIWSPAWYNSSRPLGDHAGDNPPLLEISHLSPPADPLAANARTYTSNLPDSFDAYASHRPSGENEPSRSVDLVVRNRSGFPAFSPPLSASIGTDQICGLPSGWKYASRVPSRETAVGSWMLLPACSTCGWPAPSARLHRRPLPNIP